MGAFKRFVESQELLANERSDVRVQKRTETADSNAVLAQRIVKKARRLRSTRDLCEKIDLVASQNADLAVLISKN